MDSWLSIVGSREKLLGYKALIALAITLPGLAAAITGFVSDEAGSAIRVLVFLILLLFIIFGWSLHRLAYWRLGRGIKIGISGRFSDIHHENWEKITRSTREICANLPYSSKITLRLVPEKLASSRKRSAWFLTFYKFDLLAEYIPGQDGSLEKSDLKINEQAMDTLESNFRDATEDYITFLFSIKPDHNHVRDVFESIGYRIIDSLVFASAAIKYANGEHVDCITLAQLVDGRLEKHGFQPFEQPRRGARWLASCSSIYPLLFDTSNPPIAEDLSVQVNKASSYINKYAVEFPEMILPYARAQYYTNNFEGAKDSLLGILKKSESVLNQQTKSNINVSLGFLHTIQSNYTDAARSFHFFLYNADPNMTDWGSMIDSATYGLEQGIDACLYPKVLYKHASPNHSAESLERTKARGWIKADASRAKLLRFLELDPKNYFKQGVKRTKSKKKPPRRK